MEYTYIINPETNRKCKVNSILGRRIINNYIQLGGELKDIEVNRILFDNAMKAWTKINCDEQAKAAKIRLIPPNIPATVGGLNQSKLERIEEAYLSGKEDNIIPINIQEYLFPSGKKSGYYIVVDGRHRVVKALCHGKVTIKANIN